MAVNRDFTQGKIFMPLMGFAVPVLAALLIQMLYGAVDMMIVGWFCSPSDIAAVSTGSTIMNSITIVITGLAMGTTILMGQKFGEGRRDELGKVIGVSVWLFAAAGIVLAVGMQWLSPYCIAAMKTPAEAFDAADSYVRICCAGALFIVGYNVLGSIFRGMGNSRVPLMTVSMACLINIAGDYLLVGPLRMGPAGAAIATVAAQALSVVLSLLIIRRQGLPFSFTAQDIRFDRSTAGRILRLGGPVAFQDALVNLSFLAITAIVNTLGVVAAAGVGIAERICGFIMLVPSAFNQTVSAFTAQNIGAGRPERADRALFYAISASLCAGFFMAWLSYFHGDLLVSFFVQEQADVAAAGWDYLKAYSIDCLLTSFLFCFFGYFGGWGKTKFVMWQGIIGAFGVRIPVSWIMSRRTPVSIFGMGLATPCSSLVQIILCALYFVRLKRSLKAAPAQGRRH